MSPSFVQVAPPVKALANSHLVPVKLVSAMPPPIAQGQAVDPRVKLLTASGPGFDNIKFTVQHHHEAGGHLALVSAPSPAAAAEASPAAAMPMAPAPAAAPEAQPLQPAPPAAEQPSGLRVLEEPEEAAEAKEEEAPQPTEPPAPKGRRPPQMPVMSVTLLPNENPGNSLSLSLLATGRRASTSTVAQINIIDRPGTGNDRLGVYEDALRNVIESGELQIALANAISHAVDIESVVGTIYESSGRVTPFNTKKCASHLNTMIRRFSDAYTRRMVPDALYHACDNFGQKESFSHDVVIDHTDRLKCREATKRFVSMWQYGKGKVDYTRYCLELCELKHGEDAIRCDAYKYIALGP